MNIHSVSTALSARVLEEAEPPPVALPAASGAVDSDTMAVLLEYQKLVGKEAREDRKLAQQDRVLAVSSKAAKLQQDNEAIDQAKNEAGQKFEKSMEAARSELVLGAVHGAGAKPLVLTNEPSLEYFIAASARLAQGDMRKDLELMQDRLADMKSRYPVSRSATTGLTRADKTEIAIAKLQAASRGATTTESDTSAAEQARERRNAALENIRKLLDLIRGMNPRI